MDCGDNEIKTKVYGNKPGIWVNIFVESMLHMKPFLPLLEGSANKSANPLKYGSYSSTVLRNSSFLISSVRFGLLHNLGEKLPEIIWMKMNFLKS
mgnify:CR=1 FL=1